MKYLAKWGVWGFTLTLLLILTLIVFLNSKYRVALRDLFKKNERIILSIATDRIFPNRGLGKVIKIKTPKGIEIEIYEIQASGANRLVENIFVGDHNDAQFQFLARATNLALKDLDGDSLFEIIVPTYDKSLISHLNMYKFNVNTRHFEPFKP